jgi:hypothetical protein
MLWERAMVMMKTNHTTWYITEDSNNRKEIPAE